MLYLFINIKEIFNMRKFTRMQFAAIFIILIMVLSGVAGFLLLIFRQYFKLEDITMVKYKIAAVVAEFNYDITQMMLELATSEAKNRDCEITKVVAVPGVFDMPLVIKKLLQKGEFDAIITLGAVIEGATDHDQIVAQHASRKIADLALEYDTPVALGITGPGMTRLDAHRRVKNAKSAVEAAIKMCDRLKEI